MASLSAPTLASHAARGGFVVDQISRINPKSVGAGLLAIAVWLRRTRGLTQSPPAYLGSSYKTVLYMDFVTHSDL